jgi:Fe2+ or Zn2+ uptake regulation protein
MTCSTEYISQLHSRGFRVTSQRMMILHVLRHSRMHLSPTEVYELARRNLPGLTEPTVYRTLEFLSNNRLIQSAQTHGGHLVYQITATHHHHVICSVCGRALEVEHKLLEKMYRSLETATGYMINDDHATFFGLCPKCQKNHSE